MTDEKKIMEAEIARLREANAALIAALRIALAKLENLQKFSDEGGDLGAIRAALALAEDKA